MARRRSAVLLATHVFAIALLLPLRASASPDVPGVRLTINSSEAEQVLRIVRKRAISAPVPEEDWRRLFGAEPYRWLKEREAAIGAAFTDEQFKAFVLSDEAQQHRVEWETALAGIKQSNAAAIGARVLEWLPAGATIHARVFPEIKPRHNSFVWSKEGMGPAIFIAIEKQSKDKFENTVAHECHHIGLQSLEDRQATTRSALPPRVGNAVQWLGGFGEGEAMLAAAGSTDRHPHWEDDALVRARWDSDATHFNADLEALQRFFTEILDGKIEGEDAIRKRAERFWGDAQGAWYTVGYEMSVLVEKRFGRRAFLEGLIDPRQLLDLYNQVATDANASGASLATWSPEFLARLRGSGDR